MELAWLPWLVPALLLANGIFSFALGYRSKRSIYMLTTQNETQSTRQSNGQGTGQGTRQGEGYLVQTGATTVHTSERILVRPDLGLFTENEMLRDSLARAEAVISETGQALRETKAALARSEARMADSERVKVPLSRSVFAPRARQVGGR
jgi:phosphohistidine swiveling domain-containing protein